jgi:2-methylcitrate dehydratase PrpD
MIDRFAARPLYRRAFLDWLACALAGRNEPAAVAARAVGDGTTDRVAALATAGHVLDFDDTYGPGLSHISAPTAPAALVVGATTGASIGEVLDAYVAGFEAMAAVAAASHPALYERGWHPTAVTGTIGAATAAAAVIGFDEVQTRVAQQLAVLGAGGLRSAFGTDGKALQVGVASAQGVRGALLAGWGATASDSIAAGFAAAYGGEWAEPGEAAAIEKNWIKAFPCCLQTHAAIEAAEAAVLQGADGAGSGVVTVHRRSRQAAPLDDVTTGLEAKFSIPYTVAFTILYGAPDVADFASVDAGARDLASRISVEIDDELRQSEALLAWSGGTNDSPIEIRVDAARGSPEHPLSDEQLAAKVRSLAGSRLDGVLDDPARPAAEILALVEEL